MTLARAKNVSSSPPRSSCEIENRPTPLAPRKRRRKAAAIGLPMASSTTALEAAEDVDHQVAAAAASESHRRLYRWKSEGFAFTSTGSGPATDEVRAIPILLLPMTALQVRCLRATCSWSCLQARVRAAGSDRDGVRSPSEDARRYVCCSVRGRIPATRRPEPAYRRPGSGWEFVGPSWRTNTARSAPAALGTCRVCENRPGTYAQVSGDRWRRVPGRSRGRGAP